MKQVFCVLALSLICSCVFPLTSFGFSAYNLAGEFTGNCEYINLDGETGTADAVASVSADGGRIFHGEITQLGATFDFTGVFSYGDGTGRFPLIVHLEDGRVIPGQYWRDLDTVELWVHYREYSAMCVFIRE